MSSACQVYRAETQNSTLGLLCSAIRSGLLVGRDWPVAEGVWQSYTVVSVMKIPPAPMASLQIGREV